MPHDLLGLNPEMTQIDFANLDDPNAIVAFDFAGGTQEMINVIPEPATLGPLLLGLLALLARSKGSGH